MIVARTLHLHRHVAVEQHEEGRARVALAKQGLAGREAPRFE